jgi:multiple sugar transport system substrate-binding protein
MRLKPLFAAVAIYAILVSCTPFPVSEMDLQTPITPKVTCKCGAVDIYWFIGLGPGDDPIQVKAELKVVNDFNAPQDYINLILQIVPYESAIEVLSKRIAAGNAPDIVGPLSLSESDIFSDQWLDLSDLLKKTNFDISQFTPGLMKMYSTPEGIFGLPFVTYPSALFFNRDLFDNAGFKYPPDSYGETYVMPDGSTVEWSWDTLREIARLLTLDVNGRNSTDPFFNRKKIIQYGYSWQYENHPNYWGSYWIDGTMVASYGSAGKYKAILPWGWKEAWEWTYDGMWGGEPFVSSEYIKNYNKYSNSSPFNSKRIAMTVQPYWYADRIDKLVKWDLGAMPTYAGRVGGRVDEYSFRIWKGSRFPEDAFTVLSYLVTEGVGRMIIGNELDQPALPGVPASIAYQDAWLANQKNKYSWVTNWDIVFDGLQYPDIPSAEFHVPHFETAWTRGSIFANLLRRTPGLDLDLEIQLYLSDLEVIFNK